MKWFEYIMARTIMKTVESINRNREGEEIREIQEGELKLDKGYWHYNEKRFEYIFIEPKKNEHFVTVEENEEASSCRIVLSKKPISLTSEKCDYLWDAEATFLMYAKMYRGLGYNLLLEREAPIKVVDFDLCCPYCFISSTFREWAINSYRQELLEIPHKFKTIRDSEQHEKNITIDHIETEKLWCPVCLNGIDDSKLIMGKGDEWKASKLKAIVLPKYISPLSNVKGQNDAEETYPRNHLPNSLEELLHIIEENKYAGLVIRSTERVHNKNKVIHKPKWIKPTKNIPANFTLADQIYTSYYASIKDTKLPGRHTNTYPHLYVPLIDLPQPERLDASEREKLEQARQLFHIGKPLNCIHITPNKYVNQNEYLVHLAYEIGVSHLPCIVDGNWDEKKTS